MLPAVGGNPPDPYLPITDVTVLQQPYPLLFTRSRIIPLFYKSSAMESQFVAYSYLHFTYVDSANLAAIIIFSLAYVAYWSSSVMGVASLMNAAVAFVALAIDSASRYASAKSGKSIAAMHEGIMLAALFCNSTLVGVISYANEDVCQRSSVAPFQTSAEERRAVCVHAIFPYGYAVFSIAVTCGRPRAFLMAVCAIAYVTARIVMKPLLGKDTSEEAAMKIVVDVVVLFTSLLCHTVLEQYHRASFEEYVMAFRSKQQAIKQKEATDTYLSQLLPPMLYSRLLSPEHYEDSGTSVTVFIASVTDLAAWVPAGASRAAVSDAVRRVSELMAHFEEHRKVVDVERIRVTGDEFIATSNLIVPTLSHALRIAIFATKSRPCIARSGIPVRCAIHTGAVRGYVAGTRFLRYDIRGEGVDIARHLIKCCAEGDIVVTDATKELLRERAVMLPTEEAFTAFSHTYKIFNLRGLTSIRLRVPSATADRSDPIPVASSQDSDDQSSQSVDSNSSSLDTWMPNNGREPSVSSSSGRSSSHRVHFNESSFELRENRSASSPRRLQYSQAKIERVDPLAQHCKLVGKHTDIARDETEEAKRLPESKAEAELAEATAKLAIVSEWTGRIHFRNSGSEAEYSPSLLRNQVFCSFTTLVLLSSAMSILLVVEFHGFKSTVLAGQVLLLAAIPIGSIAMAALCWMPPLIVQSSQHVVLAVLGGTVLVLIAFGAAASRPGLVANDTIYITLKYGELLAVALTGVPWRASAVATVVFIAFQYTVGIWFGYIIKTVGIFLVATLLLLVVVEARWQELFIRQRHRDMILVRMSSDVERKERDLLQTALASVVPLCLVPLLTAQWGARAQHNGLVQHVTRGVVVVMSFPRSAWQPPTEATQDLPSTTEAAEALLRTFSHITLTRVVGDVVVAAGPLTEQDLPKAASEAMELVEGTRGRCTAVVTLGSFYAIVTGGMQQASFFLLGDAVYSAKMNILAARPLSAEYSEDFMSVFNVAESKAPSSASSPDKSRGASPLNEPQINLRLQQQESFRE